MGLKPETTQHHMLSRTNAKGQGIAFIGRCVLCGEEGLPAEAVAFPCPGGMGRSYPNELAKIIRGDVDA